jgi:HSP20 family protein
VHGKLCSKGESRSMQAARTPGTPFAPLARAHHGVGLIEGYDMANIAVQQDKSTPQASAPVRSLAHAWEPFRAMRDLLRWDPFGEMLPSFNGRLEAVAFSPDFDVKETKESFIFTADMPGVKESDLEVRLTQNRLTIAGKRESEKVEKTDQFYAAERSYGSFTRAFTLPEGIASDKIQAELKGGVLTLAVPKRPEAQPKKIEVQSR